MLLFVLGMAQDLFYFVFFSLLFRGGAGLEFVVSTTTMAFPRAVASASVLFATSGCCSSAWSGPLGIGVSSSAGVVLGALVLGSALSSTSYSGTIVWPLVC